MKLSRRVLPLAAAGVTAAVLLAGCSGPAPATVTKTPGKPAGTIQLSFWGSAVRVGKYEQIDQQFQEKFPGTTVQASSVDYDTYVDKLKVQAASKSMPCVTTLQGRMLNDFSANGALQDLTPLVKSGQIDVSDIPKTVLDTGRGQDGKLYMIPFGVAWNVITVNAAMAKQYGIPLLKKGYSWDDYAAWLKDAASKLPKGVVVTGNEGRDETLFIAYAISHGYKLFNEKGQLGFPKSILEDYWNKWEKYRKAGYTTTPQQDAEGAPSLEQTYVALGKSLSQQTAGNALPTLQKANPSADFKTMAFASDKGRLGNMFVVNGYAIPVGCNNVDTAAAYINFWVNDDKAASTFASDNGAVANSRQLKEQVAAATGGLKSVLEQYQYILSEKVPAQALPSGYTEVMTNQFERTYDDIAFGRKSVKDAVDTFFSDATATLSGK